MTRFGVLAALLLTSLACRASADDRPLTPEQLAAQSKLVVVGRVVAYGVQDFEEDGGKAKYVCLQVEVEAVQSGSGPVQPGAVILVLCRVPAQPAQDGVTVGPGQGAIPGVGGQAKFYLSGETVGVWAPVEPNGVELLDATPAIMFPPEPPVLDRQPSVPRMRWSVTLALAVVVFSLLAVAYVRVSRSRSRLRGSTSPR